jgi:hypothetical protein
MDFFSRITPGYKSVSTGTAAHSQPAASSGLTGLIGSLFGSATPAYKTIDGQSAKAPASSGFWSMFGTAPSYKTAPAATVAPFDADPGVDEDGACAPGPDEIVVL